MAKKIAKSKKKKAIEEEVICSRCEGDGIWHSPKTGVRAVTSAEPLIDASRKCPKCKGMVKSNAGI